ncbi:putative MADS-box transcription factor 27-like [Capsicum annuum]|uniref:XIAP-associated factor 1 n=1 Tax=Capsicum annuum TaxID=4072 RepID=UPI001FB11964|nr:XIAP-associated factor 1 [Capsicum annuum]KAF3632096.1 putative MADS-box transcription factor 27-like [Capsicum annuum]KAF3636716.1 putative MADS-box transcription factor 27-like [Capsicum annuum]
MAVASDQTTSICNNCDREIPSLNLDLHVAHCSLKLEKCKICGLMVPKKHADKHFLKKHAPVTCSLCNETVEREELAVHKGENCPQRMLACEYCEFPLPAIDLIEHQEVCGNRTELCHLCSRYIMLRERSVHESRCNGSTNNITESSRAIPSSNHDFHVAHSSPKLEKCKTCGDMVPEKDAEEHFLRTHAPVACSLCNETVEREVLAVHKRENCPQRVVTCEYCKHPFPAIDLFKHQEVCGNRAERCHLCSRYIRLCDRNAHERRCNGKSSRNTSQAERDRGALRTQQHEGPKPPRVLTIAIIGIAVVLGALFYQRKA